MNQVYEGHLSRHAAVHDAVVDLHGGDDREGHSVWEGATVEGGDEGDGARKCSPLAVVVHYQLRHDAAVSAAACRRTQGYSNCYIYTVSG